MPRAAVVGLIAVTPHAVEFVAILRDAQPAFALLRHDGGERVSGLDPHHVDEIAFDVAAKGAVVVGAARILVAAGDEIALLGQAHVAKFGAIPQAVEVEHEFRREHIKIQRGYDC